MFAQFHEKIGPIAAVLAVFGLLILSGCRTYFGCNIYRHPAEESVDAEDPASIGELGFEPVYGTQIEQPMLDESFTMSAALTPPPRTVRHFEGAKTWELKLDDVIHLALENSQVIRDVGGKVVDAPLAARTVFDPALAETDPQSSIQAALAEFDAQLAASFSLGGNERTLNNVIAGEGVRDWRQEFGTFRTGIWKTTATGTRFALNHVTAYDRNNSPLNLFPSSWDTTYEAEIRHPLLQGAGIEFNRIAGPNARPGEYRGILLARLKTDVALADFEADVRDLLRDVERTYWELHFAYRVLDARIAARDATLEFWRAVKARLATGAADGEQEALARERYHAAQAAVDDALSGTPIGAPTRTPTTSRLNMFDGGVLAVERRLRFLIGLPSSDERLIRPVDEPTRVDIAFDWYDSLHHALLRRVELRRQAWTIKRRESELVAARNFQRMRLDLVGQYRVRGFGDDLMGAAGGTNASAYGDLFRGELQDWIVGIELRQPIGNRAGHNAARNAELALARERAILDEQQHQVAHELSGAFAELDRAYTVSRANFNRRVAARQRFDAAQAKFASGAIPLEFLLEAQQQNVDAEIAFQRAMVDYCVSLSNLHLARGSLLDSVGVHLTEAPSTPEAYRSQAEQAHRFRRNLMNYCLKKPPPLSSGPLLIEEQLLDQPQARGDLP